MVCPLHSVKQTHIPFALRLHSVVKRLVKLFDPLGQHQWALAKVTGGGGGIRTLGTGFSQCNCLAGSSVKPLRHPSAGNGLAGSVYYRATGREERPGGT